MKRPLVVALLIPALLASCAPLLFPYEQPETPAPAAWREADATADNSWPDAEWWKKFNSPELNHLIAQALENNHDIAAAIALVRQANATVLINGSPLLPSVEADASGTHTHVGRKSAGGSGNSYNATLSASYELDFWGKNYAALQSAQAARDASVFDAQVVRLSVISSVANVYFDLLATNERLAIANENLSNANDLLEALKKREKEGIANALDVAQQESVVASENAAIAPLILHQTQDRNALAVLVGVLPETLPPPKEKLNDLTAPTVPAGLPSGLLARRPDVAEAESSLIAAHANINQARAAFFPSISLTGETGYASTALHSLFNPGSVLTSFGASLVQPIFKGGLLVGGLELSQGQYEELAHTYQKTVLSAFADTENSLAGVKQNAAERDAQQQAAQTAKKAYDLSQRQFRGGIIDITTVLNTQRTLFSANDSYAQAKLGHLQAIASLYTSLGGGWKTPSDEQSTPKAAPAPTDNAGK